MLKFKYVEIDGKKLTVGLFRQLPTEELCDGSGRRREELSPFGVVRYKHESSTLWALATRGTKVVRCPLSPILRPQKELEEKLEFWTRHAQMPHNQSKGQDSSAHREADRYKAVMAAEPGRFAVHEEVAKLEQVFL